MGIKHTNIEKRSLGRLVGSSPQMLALYEKIRRVARTDATVLLRGESGTGKELVAEAIHDHSARSKKQMRAVNCATFTSDFLASELFGHVRGAFTGAVKDKAGLLAQADKSTLFLDEIAELSLGLQARMLRVLQAQRFIPVGGTTEKAVDVRLISATNTALRAHVRAGLFREDLMYRLRVVVIYLPRLVERVGDIELLLWHFIDEFNGNSERNIVEIDEAAWRAIHDYHWPGNVRELRNNIEQAFVLGDGNTLHLNELTPEVQGFVDDDEMPRPVQQTPVQVQSLEEIQRLEILDAYRVEGGRRGAMARRLHISRSTLYRRMKALELDNS